MSEPKSFSDLFQHIPEKLRVYYTCPTCGKKVWVNKMFSLYKGPCENCVTKTGDVVSSLWKKWVP